MWSLAEANRVELHAGLGLNLHSVTSYIGAGVSYNRRSRFLHQRALLQNYRRSQGDLGAHHRKNVTKYTAIYIVHKYANNNHNQLRSSDFELIVNGNNIKPPTSPKGVIFQNRSPFRTKY